MIEIKELTKIYKLSSVQMKKARTKKNTKIAVDSVSFTAREGEIYGLLGPNGAGKTTTLRCLATLLKPTQGSVTVDGFDASTSPDEVRKRIGFLTNEIKLDPQFSVDYLFDFLADFTTCRQISLQRERKSCLIILELTALPRKRLKNYQQE